MTRSRMLGIVFVAAFALLIAFFALRSSPFFQPISWLPRWIGRWADSHGIARNLAAFFAFGFAAFVILGPRWRLCLILSAFATVLEVSQIWIPTRIYDWKDIVASVAGILLAWPLAWLVHRLKRRA
ncbi:MAG TPA: VanZ family protein [Opitutaceae bacterium]